METHHLTEYLPHFVPAYVANGVVGLRPDVTPHTGYCTVNGYAGAHLVDGVESWLYAPYPLAFDVEVDGQWLSQSQAQTHLVEQSYNFSCGELRSEVAFRGVRVQLTQFCSRSVPFGVAGELRIHAERPMSINLRVGFDGSRGEVKMVRRGEGTFQDRNVCDGYVLWETPDARSQLGGAFIARLEGKGHTPAPDAFTDGWANQWQLDVDASTQHIVHHFATLVPSVMHREPERQAIRLAYLMAERGWEQLREENHKLWNELWRGRPILHGADSKWQRIADACFFYLHSSAHRSSPCSTSLFGVGQWPGYHCFRGHIFWDIETFTVPPLILTAPESARALLDYRFRNLDAARRNAALNGYTGIQFPWESGPLSGEEVTPSGWPHIFHEQHISMDVAFAFAQYAHASGDMEFARERAWPILKGVAQWISDRVLKTNRGYELRHAMGICEDIPTDNNAFVLMAAGSVLREAIGMAQRFEYSVPQRWRDIAANLAFPRKGDLILRCDGDSTERFPDATETLAGFYPQTHRESAKCEIATLGHYLERGQKALGMPMLPPLFAVHAARLGDRTLALEMLERGIADYVIEPFFQLDEFGDTKTRNKNKVGPYLAHIGAFVMNLLIGFPGLQLSHNLDDWAQFPVVLPQGWDAIEVEQLHIHGSTARLTAKNGTTRATLHLQQ